MASTNTASGSVQKSVNSHSSKQEIRAIVTDLIKTKFATTLGQAPDIINIVMALIYKESTFNATNSRGPNYENAHLQRVLKYSAISKVYNTGTAVQRANIVNSVAAFGLCQVSGYYCIKGAGPSGKSEMDRMRPDLSAELSVEPGENVTTKLWGQANAEKQILAGLIVLEGKYKEIAPRLVSQGKYSNRLTAAVAAYLGLGAKDSIGTTPEKYANSIIRGSAYQIANNGKGPDGTPLVASGSGSTSNAPSSAGPAKTAASGNNLTVAGC